MALSANNLDWPSGQWSDQDKAWPLNTPGTQEAEDGIWQQTPTLENNTQVLKVNMQVLKLLFVLCLVLVDRRLVDEMVDKKIICL